MSTERDELADMVGGPSRENGLEVAAAILAAGYRKIFDGDCGLSNAAPDERDAAEAWMRWANILTIGPDEERNGIAAMRQMLTEFGYRKPRTVTTVEELGTVHAGAILIDAIGEQWGVYGGEDRLFLVADGWEETYDDNDIPLPATVVWEPTNA